MNATQDQIKPASMGTVISATLRDEDLLPAFATELEYQINRNGQFFSQPDNFELRDRLNKLVGEAQDCFGENGETIDESKVDDASELINEIQDALTQHFAGPYCYFGAHCGDGSDFGFWPDMDAIHELPIFEAGDDIELPQPGDYAMVNDHGNIEVYSGAIHEIIDRWVPIYTHEIEATFFLHGKECEEAFDNAGIGEKNDKGWPNGWKAAAIYCHIESKVHEWYSKHAEGIFDEWKASKKD